MGPSHARALLLVVLASANATASPEPKVAIACPSQVRVGEVFTPELTFSEGAEIDEDAPAAVWTIVATRQVTLVECTPATDAEPASCGVSRLPETVRFGAVSGSFAAEAQGTVELGWAGSFRGQWTCSLEGPTAEVSCVIDVLPAEVE